MWATCGDLALLLCQQVELTTVGGSGPFTGAICRLCSYHSETSASVTVASAIHKDIFASLWAAVGCSFVRSVALLKVAFKIVSSGVAKNGN